MQTTTTQIMELLQYNEEQLAHFIFNCGIDYLEQYFNNDQEAIELLQTNRAFWTWFKNQWRNRDEVFVDHMLHNDMLSLHAKRELYQSLHNASQLVCEIYPSATVLGSHFSKIKIQLSSC